MLFKKIFHNELLSFDVKMVDTSLSFAIKPLLPQATTPLNEKKPKPTQTNPQQLSS